MEFFKIDKNKIKISRLGIGGCPFGAHGWGAVEDKNSIDSIRTALNLGVNFFDTADIYGLGHSEKIFARALGKKRDQVIIATKGGLRKKGKSIVKDSSAKWLKIAINNSLIRLKIDCIPLYFIHCPDPNTLIKETIETLESVRQSGKIKYIGLSNFSLSQIKQAQKYGKIDAIQDSYNLIDQANEKKFIYCKKNNISTIVYGPLAQGLLTGKYDINTRFDKSDRRSRKSYINFHGTRFKANLKIVEKIKEIAVKYNKTCAQISLRWVLDSSSVTALVVGAKTSEQIKGNIDTLNWKLSKKDYKFLKQMVIKNDN